MLLEQHEPDGFENCPVSGAGNQATATISLLSEDGLDCPYPAFSKMRAEQPIAYVEEQNLWIVTRYDDCEFVLAHPELFSSRESMSSTNAYRRSSRAVDILRTSRAYPRARTLVLTDPPDHGRFRKIIQRALSPAQTVRMLTPQMSLVIEDLIDQFIHRGHCEFVREFAYPLPMRVIARVLDVSEDEIDLLKSWSDDFISVQAGNVPEHRLVSSAQRVLEFEEYFSAKLEERRLHPQDDFLGRLVAPVDGERPLTLAELLSLITQIIVGGNESTTNFLGNAVYLILTTPGLQERIRQEPKHIPSLVEEILRFDAPVQGLFRIATEEVEINGVRVPEGAKLMVHFGSANRDEAYYDESFDPDRDNRSTMHLTFGRGIHACVGQALARREGVLALQQLFARLDDVRLDATRTPARQALFGIRGMRRLPITFSAAATQISPQEV